MRPYACCLGESDEEKDDKDDEGYDSYGITTSQNHLQEHQQLSNSRNALPEQQHTVSIETTENRQQQSNFDSHEYVNESDICPIESKLNVAMRYDDKTNVASHSALQYTDILDTSTCNNNKHEYVNESVLFSKLTIEKENNTSTCSQSPSLNRSNEFKTERTNTVSTTDHRNNLPQANESPGLISYETRSLESKVADAVSSQQTLILLETDV